MDRIGLNPIKIDIMSLGGAVFVFSLFLMPYVFLVTKSFFNRFPVNLEEASKLLGRGPRQTFFEIVLPLSNLNSHLLATVREELFGIIRQLGMTTIMVTHNLEDAEKEADSTIRIVKGAIEVV